MTLEYMGRLFQVSQLGALVLSPCIAIWYLTVFSATTTLPFEDHLFHEVAVVFASLIGGFVSYVSWRSYKVSGEVFLRWLTVGLLSFTVIYMPHGILTRTAHHNMWLFLLFGPVSRLALLGCMVYGLTQYGKPAESPDEVTRRSFWRNVMVACGASIVFVAMLAFSPVASSRWPRKFFSVKVFTIRSRGGSVISC